MMTPESKSLNEKNSTNEFIDGLSRLVIKYRSEIPTGALIGAIEIVKLRIFNDTMKIVLDEEDEKASQSL